MILNQQQKEMIARFWADMLEIEDKRELFYKELLALIPDDSEAITGRYNDCIGVDYDPDYFLLEALRACKILCLGVGYSAKGIFPYKTEMYFYSDKIEYKIGYGAPWYKLEDYFNKKAEECSK
jgi:hypothetical protein